MGSQIVFLASIEASLKEIVQMRHMIGHTRQPCIEDIQQGADSRQHEHWRQRGLDQASSIGYRADIGQRRQVHLQVTPPSAQERFAKESRTSCHWPLSAS